MTLTATLTPTFAPSLDAAQAAALSSTRTLVRAAIRLPFDASRTAAWLSRFTEYVTGVRLTLAANLARTEQNDSELATLRERHPHLAPAIDRLQGEQLTLLRSAASVSRAASLPGRIDGWRVINLREDAMRLDHELRRHCDGLLSIAFEASNREIGGEG
jgi:hypothetical protein